MHADPNNLGCHGQELLVEDPVATRVRDIDNLLKVIVVGHVALTLQDHTVVAGHQEAVLAEINGEDLLHLDGLIALDLIGQLIASY